MYQSNFYQQLGRFVFVAAESCEPHGADPGEDADFSSETAKEAVIYTATRVFGPSFVIKNQ